MEQEKTRKWATTGNKGRGRLDLNKLVAYWDVKPYLTNFIYLYMKTNSAINSSNFSNLLAKSTKCETTTLLLTPFRQPGALVGVSDCSHKFGSLAPWGTNFSAAGFSVGITHICNPDHMSPEETDNFSAQDHGFLSTAPLLMSLIYGKHLRGLRKKK